MTADSAPAESAPAFQYVHTPGFAALLERLEISLFISTYQAGKLIVVRGRHGKLSTLLRSFDQPMGLAVDHRRLVIGTRNQVWFFQNAPGAAGSLDPRGEHDACYLPRRCHVTGDVRIHELGWAGEQLCFVNTRFSCLCTVDAESSFSPLWRPWFISRLDGEDRCHVNGLALVDGEPRFVTALGMTDSPAGWRENKVAGGCLIDVRTNSLVATGLCMPHSPRQCDGRLFVLNSGRGELLSRRADGGLAPVVTVPGYARGLALLGEYVFIGTSRIRESSTFGHLPITRGDAPLRCGVWVADWTRGRIVEFLEFTAGIEEIFDVQVLQGVRYPAVIGFEKPEINSIFVLP